MGPETADGPSDILTRLRTATGAAHRQLEGDLDLLAEPLVEGRFRQVLERFWSFHRVWEPAMAQHPEIAAFIRMRTKLPFLRTDLLALGLAEETLSTLPFCPSAVELSASLAFALGSLYVMEGSHARREGYQPRPSELPVAPARRPDLFRPVWSSDGLNVARKPGSSSKAVAISGRCTNGTRGCRLLRDFERMSRTTCTQPRMSGLRNHRSS